MFKKNHNIPPRPKPPIAEQVLHDINTAPEDDVVFRILNPTTDHLKSHTAGALSDTYLRTVNEDTNNPDAVYQKVQSFLEVNSNLQAMMQKLQEQNELLISSDSELKKMAEDIRRQALAALK